MDLAEIVGIVLAVVGVTLTFLNIYYSNSPSVYAIMETKQLGEGGPYKYPKNKLGPCIFQPGSQYLDLVIINGGPGIAKKVCWKMSSSFTEKCEKGWLPYLAPKSRINVRGFIEKKTNVNEIEETTYTLTLKFKRFLWFEQKSAFYFNGEGGSKMNHECQ